jgi:hypothetical protein
VTAHLEALLTAITGIKGVRPPADLVPYVANLYDRRNEGGIIPGGRIEGTDWTPAFNDCHANVNALCGADPRYRPVRGWRYFDFHNFLSFVRFTAHSIVADASGRLWDITPSRASQHYPFILAEGTEEEFVQIVEVRGLGNLDHFR